MREKERMNNMTPTSLVSKQKPSITVITDTRKKRSLLNFHDLLTRHCFVCTHMHVYLTCSRTLFYTHIFLHIWYINNLFILFYLFSHTHTRHTPSKSRKKSCSYIKIACNKSKGGLFLNLMFHYGERKRLFDRNKRMWLIFMLLPHTRDL